MNYKKIIFGLISCAIIDRIIGGLCPFNYKQIPK